MISKCPDCDSMDPDVRGEDFDTGKVCESLWHNRCPTCESPAPEQHPAVQHEGEVVICRDRWHSSTNEGMKALFNAVGHPWADEAYGPLAEDLQRKKMTFEEYVRAHQRKQQPAPEEPVVAEPTKTVTRWADNAMFTSEPLEAQDGPKVYLIGMTADPLAHIAAACKMYKGEVVHQLSDVTRAERLDYLEQVTKTRLQMPFEAVQFHFLLEGVTRSFTHQLVRQRTAAYAQESLRFAVVEDGLTSRTALPPSLAATRGVWRRHEEEVFSVDPNCDPDGDDYRMAMAARMARESTAEQQRWSWDQALNHIDASYQYLVNSGVPAEDARGLLPHNVTTRVHYITNLRGLLDHAGNRLCTQAQFEWRLVFAAIRDAIRNYDPYADLTRVARNLDDAMGEAFVQHVSASERYQYELLADLLLPVCYQTGKCEFKANFDRPCSIRGRVDANQELGRPSSEWGQEYDRVTGSPIVVGAGPTSVVRNEEGQPVFIGAIQPREWLADPAAAR